MTPEVPEDRLRFLRPHEKGLLRLIGASRHAQKEKRRTMARIPILVGAWGNISVCGKRGNYRASARFRQANGKTVPRFRTGATKEAARNVLLEHLTGLREQTIAGEVSSSTTVGSFAKDWLQRWGNSDEHPPAIIATCTAAVK